MQTLLPSKFTGIIQLTPADETQLLELQQAVLEQHPDQQPNPKLHVTLLHQSFPKKLTSSDGLRGDKALKAFFKSGGQMSIPTPTLELGDVKVGEDPTNGRKSSYVEINNSMALLELRDEILYLAGLDLTELDAVLTPEEKGRIFHISLTNLEGNGGASIAYPGPNDANVVIR